MRTASVLFCIALILVVTTLAAPPGKLKRIFLLHRHGARNSLVVHGTRIKCGASPSCEITDEGKDMLLSLGNYLKTNYKQQLGISDSYNVSYISSNSTDFPRTTISAEAVIMGLFQGQDPLPFVDFVPKTQDRELVMWDSWPTWILRNTYDKEVHKHDAWINANFNKSVLSRIGTFFSAQELCTTVPGDCLAYANDQISCNISAGNAVPKWLLDLYPLIKVSVAKFLSNVLGYHPRTSDYSKQIGSYGFPLANAALNFLSQKTTPGTRADLMKMSHVGAHDWTVFSLLTTLGTWTPETADDGEQWVVSFAEAVILEVWEDETGGNQTIRARRGTTTQAPGTHDYTFSDMNVQCITKEGNAYNSSSSGYACPIADLQRFVASTAPAAGDNSQCYATDETLKQQNCDGNDAPTAGSRCLFYRQNCPDSQCGSIPGGIADPARGYACQTAQLDKGTPFVVATMIALMAPSLLAGATIGFYGANKIKRLLWKKGDKIDLDE